MKDKIEKNKERKFKSSVIIFSYEASDNCKNPVKEEAKRICQNRKWGSLAAMFALSSITNRKIRTVYPETLDLNYKVFSGIFKKICLQLLKKH